MRKLNWRFILLLPLSASYALITSIRNFLYDYKILKTESFDIPVISVGNLAVGGTGKTPHTEFFLTAIDKKYKCAVLSRGYKRSTNGYFEANEDSDFRMIGDEPLQIFRKHRNVLVAVDEKRVNGIRKIKSLYPEVQAIILDDAFQHRQVKPGLSVLLTCYNKLFTSDYLLPGGSLRESKNNYRRADIIIVTKCPLELATDKMEKIAREINPGNHLKLFFSSFEYDGFNPVFENTHARIPTFDDLRNNKTSVLIVTGIASPAALENKINEWSDKTESLHFPDHHNFSVKDIRKIEQKFKEIKNEHKIILTTEKDAVRLMNQQFISDDIKANIFYIPIKVKILDSKEDILIKTITDYVGKNSGNN